MHHASIRTADIHRAIAFYEQLGFQVHERFTAGITLACWMEGLGGRIELIQVPQPRPATDAFGDEHYTGYYHLSFDLTHDLTGAIVDLPDWVAGLEQKLEAAGMSPLKLLLPPQQQQIGENIYEVAFIADADGLPLEFIRRVTLPESR
jgi:catechol 2,3-dioxygenase-like lactoylglutathione lyase family enzyme